MKRRYPLPLRRPLAALALALGLGLLTGASAFAGGATPTATIESFEEGLLSIMRQADELGLRGRYEVLEPIMNDSFDFATMTRIAIGRHWSGLEETQKDRLIKAFGRMSVTTFAKRFDGYSGEKFVVDGEKQGPRKTVLVQSRLIKSNGEAVGLDYLLQEGETGWRVVDIYLDSRYSELATKRSEYGAVIARDGIEALIQELESRGAIEQG